MKDNIRQLLRTWFSFEIPIDRRTYITHGAVLMVVKYSLDVLIVWLVLNRFWSPLNYLNNPLYSFPHPNLTAAPPWFMISVLLWTIPFLWAGVSLTTRRAVDAGMRPWLGLLFFVPAVNYLVMLLLCNVPSRERYKGSHRAQSERRSRMPRIMLATGTGALIGLTLIAVLTLGLGSYGVALFLGTPVVIGAASAAVLNYREQWPRAATYQVALAGAFLVGGALLLLSLEGMICLIMAVPFLLLLVPLGAELGRAFVAAVPRPTQSTAMVLLALPVLGGAESIEPNDRRLFEAVTSIDIAAQPGVVWQHVIGFSEIPDQTDWLFRRGIAFPLRARIEGTGVGAVRHCEFSTGAFVEPITRWEPGRRLSFDVIAQPQPMREWSPYTDIHPPHLDGYFVSKRGEFRLTPLPGGGTRLEGSTWYELEIYPQAYWRIHADFIVHRIHRRVLRHVKRLAEEY